MLNIQSTIIVFIAALLMGIGLGAFFGLRHGDAEIGKLKAALTEVKNVSLAAEKHYVEEIKQLREKTVQIQAKADEDLAKSTQVLRDFQTNQAKLLSKKETEIANLKVLISTRKTELKKLKGQLATAKTDAERAAIQIKIDAEEKALAASKVRSAGLKCLTTPIPEEYIVNLNNS